MATTLRNKVINNVGTTPTTILAVDASSSYTVIGLSLANLTNGVLLIDVTIEDSESTVGHFLKELIVPPNTTIRAVNGGEKLILASDNTLRVTSSVDESVDVIASYAQTV